MELINTLRSEFIKLRRTSLWYLCLIAAAILPAMVVIEFGAGSVDNIKYAADPWNLIFMKGLEFNTLFFMPVYIVLMCTLFVQIEFRNNTWKQVFTTPQSKFNLFLSKFLIIQFFILLFFMLYNFLMVLAIILVNFIEPSYRIFSNSLDINFNFPLYGKLYLCLAVISAIPRSVIIIYSSER